MLERVERTHEVELRVRERHGGRVGFDEADAGMSCRIVEEGIREVERGGPCAGLREVAADHPVRAGDLESARPAPLQHRG
jgi:hypothetical protein